MPAPWQLTAPMTDSKVTVNGHTYWRHKTTGHWWSNDTAKHAGCAFKVYEMIGGNLIWIADADTFGNYILKKHKSPKGKTVTFEMEGEDT
jgi:hypothetical protein